MMSPALAQMLCTRRESLLSAAVFHILAPAVWAGSSRTDAPNTVPKDANPQPQIPDWLKPSVGRLRSAGHPYHEMSPVTREGIKKAYESIDRIARLKEQGSAEVRLTSHEIFTIKRDLFRHTIEAPLGSFTVEHAGAREHGIIYHITSFHRGDQGRPVALRMVRSLGIDDIVAESAAMTEKEVEHFKEDYRDMVWKACPTADARLPQDPTMDWAIEMAKHGPEWVEPVKGLAAFYPRIRLVSAWDSKTYEEYQSNGLFHGSCPDSEEGGAAYLTFHHNRRERVAWGIMKDILSRRSALILSMGGGHYLSHLATDGFDPTVVRLNASVVVDSDLRHYEYLEQMANKERNQQRMREALKTFDIFGK